MKQYFRRYYKQCVLGPLFKLFEAILELCVPLLVAQLIDEAIPTGSVPHIMRYVILMIGVALVGVVLSISAQYFSAQAAVGITSELTQGLFQHILHLPKKVRDSLTSAKLVTRLTNDTYQIQTGLNLFFRLLLRSPFIVFGATFMAWRIDRRLTIYFLLMILLLFIVIGMLLKLMSPYQQRIRQQVERLIKRVQEQLTGMRVIRAFNQSERQQHYFTQVNEQYANEQLTVGRLSAWMNPLTMVIVNVTLIMILWQGGHHINSGHLQQGQLVALVNYLLQILIELVKMTQVVLSTNRAFISAKRIREVLAQPIELPTQAINKKAAAQANNVIRMEQVTFYHEGAEVPALEQVNLSAKQGEFIGIIGGTGAGKSTLVQLLAQLYPVSAGDLSIQLDEAGTLAEYRQQLGVVPQQAELFKGTVRSNLLLANPQATQEEMWRALQIAQASEFVNDLEMPIQAFGKNLSGGQRQRLTIARALVKPMQLLILDDATSALDYLTEARLLKAIRESLVNVTVIIVSQRTRTLAKADHILVLDSGRVVGSGKHEELLDTCAVYREIHQSQQGVSA
ncbi:MAG: ABC transporter ATP-binding protein [Aerococcaceae bacterium]|nr:ABC transporter ATP-binding protein [Aerococcaceae bacterium]